MTKPTSGVIAGVGLVHILATAALGLQAADISCDNAIVIPASTCPPQVTRIFRHALIGLPYSNGPLITHPGGGFGGADASALQTALSMNTYGLSNSHASGYRIADDFTISDPDSWKISAIVFYEYQNESGTASPLKAVYLQIWDGLPGNASSSVIWGDLTTNRMTTTAFSSIYRVKDTILTDYFRPVMTITAAVDTTLPSGTYWLDWMVEGSSDLQGPWVPPISILGQTRTGNGRQYTPSSHSWKDIVDDGSNTPQGMPFEVEGTVFQPTPLPPPPPTPTPLQIVRVVASHAVASSGDPFNLNVSILPIMDRPFDAYAVVFGPAGVYSIKFGNLLAPGVSPIARRVFFLPQEYHETILSMTIPPGIAGNYQAIVGLVDEGGRVTGVQNAFAWDVAYFSVN